MSWENMSEVKKKNVRGNVGGKKKISEANNLVVKMPGENVSGKNFRGRVYICHMSGKNVAK